ncbi:hypothetical protein ACWCO0_04600 [Streptomyces tubercidicus]|uniref:Uncharacterized protein n=1 Tax=Streptomyces tubercidicus TaxID=47759 RepID=A0A640UZL3_9ACTN|nr:hypothetical protein [Streptomyces tubercidicus]WAU15486.1 hypothetical protein STRTU_006210 [Streptomyces tubercidicus]GFE41349.1 hypothetical protein Stube_60220 [Streptomyces tubercidicus]
MAKTGQHRKSGDQYAEAGPEDEDTDAEWDEGEEAEEGEEEE